MAYGSTLPTTSSPDMRGAPSSAEAKPSIALPAIGKITLEDGHCVCLVTALSSTVVVADVYNRLETGERVIVECRGLDPVEAVVDRASRTTVELLLLPPHGTPSRVKHLGGTIRWVRAPRFDMLEPARLRVGANLLQIAAVDFSEGGAKLDVSGTDRAMVLGQDTLGLVNFRGLSRPRLGRIRWSAAGKMGFRFNELLPLEEMECVLRVSGLSIRRG